MAGPPKQASRHVFARKRGKGTRRIHIFRAIYLVPFLFFLTIVVALWMMMAESPNPTPEYTAFSTVTGYFQQDNPITEDRGFDYTTTNFGLVDRAYHGDSQFDPDHKKSQWERFGNEVARLNHDSKPKVQYKLLYMGRHGEGYHNVAEAFYGTHDWDIASQNIPTPESYYTSPLLRCLATANVTFSGLDLTKDRQFVPIIKELFREELGVHTCDRRSSKSIIRENYPNWPFEAGFKEDDPLWDAEHRETNEAMDMRLMQALEDVFSNDKNTYISISSHSGAIGSILRVLGHRNFSLGTGQVIPVLVKAEQVAGEGPPKGKGPYTTISTCSAPSATAVPI
ncbi:putative phosphoglycerate mutase [Lachnellula hyalina]|uniref:Putative phosphoglycerate mutase n=1 Tax=Lachnellula hyalina TaxID=1316788 RepID=A0A8H8QVW7_9HELO|nr:putative phosphoglycerate mutase [Lachnellula hyalina]TVY22354.1 putative phosphoglycerate mutase [Lachnellula hyalina]